MLVFIFVFPLHTYFANLILPYIFVGKSAPSLFDSLVETSLIGKYNMPVKGTAPPGATKVISTGQHPMIGIFNITKVS